MKNAAKKIKKILRLTSLAAGLAPGAAGLDRQLLAPGLQLLHIQQLKPHVLSEIYITDRIFQYFSLLKCLFFITRPLFL